MLGSQQLVLRSQKRKLRLQLRVPPKKLPSFAPEFGGRQGV
jgi:hypothetical protein